jgi:hypothetical protein
MPQRTALIRRAGARLCSALGWASLHEVRLPNGRRADLLALLPDGRFACIEVKSGLADFRADAKWPEYRDYADLLFFAVDADFPHIHLPDDAGLIVCAGLEAALLRDPAEHRLAPARRRAMTQLFATLAATRLARLLDPADPSPLRAD